MTVSKQPLVPAIAVAAVAVLLGAAPGAAGDSEILGSDSPAWSPDGGTLAYVGFRAGRNGDIYVRDAAGGEERRLTSHPAQDDAPRWSPDGTRIAFVRLVERYYQLLVMNADGTGERQLTSGNASSVAPAWSPDGSRIAFVTNRDGNPEVYVMNADGSAQTRLTADPAQDNHPAWSPDGSRILFTSTRFGTGAIHLYVMRADGSEPRKFTDHPVTFHNETRPTWSRDGTKVAFVSDRDPPLGNTEIYVVDGDGRNTRRLTRNVLRDDYPNWSPDGSRLAVARGFNAYRPEIYVLNADGTGARKLTGTTLRFVRFVRTPRRPVAARSFTLVLAVRPELDRFADLYCLAAIGNRPLQLARGGLVRGRLRCTWRLPRGTSGKIFRAVIGVSTGGSDVSRTVSTRIR